MVNMISMVSDIVLGISAIAVAFVAMIGLSTWRRELAGKAIFEASKKMMGFVYKIVDGYQWTASLMTYSTESIDRTRQPGESDAVKLVLDEWYAKSKRLESVLKNYNELAEANWEVKTILGQEAAKNIEERLVLIRKEIVNLSTAIYSYFEIGQQEAESGHNTRNTEFKEEMRKIVYQSPDSEEFKKLNVLVGDIDRELSPYLRGASRIRW